MDTFSGENTGISYPTGENVKQAARRRLVPLRHKTKKMHVTGSNVPVLVGQSGRIVLVRGAVYGLPAAWYR